MSFITVKYYICMELDRCPKIGGIYDHQDSLLYERDINDTIPQCCGMSSPPPGKCTVCYEQNTITIICNEAVPKEGEDKRYHLTLNKTQPVRMYQASYASTFRVLLYLLFWTLSFKWGRGQSSAAVTATSPLIPHTYSFQPQCPSTWMFCLLPYWMLMLFCFYFSSLGPALP